MHHFFSWIDWGVVLLYLAFTTLVGHALRGKQGTIRDFFLGGRTLPWQAVSGSIIATEISALTFIGVPGTVFAVSGDFTYLQWALGSVIARFAVGYWLVPLYYQREIYSPYDFMGERLGVIVKNLVTVLFSLGAILGQSVRVMVTALILKVVTGLEIELCIGIIGVFAIGWTLMGGMRTVIWTDVVQFFLFVGGGLLALIWLIAGVDGGWKAIDEGSRQAEIIEFVTEDGGDPQFQTIYQVQTESGVQRTIPLGEGIGVVEGEGENVRIIRGDGSEITAAIIHRNKMKLWELRFKDPKTQGYLIFTLWIALLAMPFQNFAAFGTDQLMAQRMFCCKNESDARKAIVWSSVSIFITILMLLVSAGLYVWYQQRPITESEFNLFIDDKNNVFPVWITKVLPVGLSGLLIAGAFAAAISSLDSILAALSQTTLSAVYGRERFEEESGSKRMVWISRAMVCGWGVALVGVAILLHVVYEMGEKNLIGFAFRMVAYTYGPMLGILLLAVLPVKRSTLGIIIGTVISVALAAYAMPDVYNLLTKLGGENSGSPVKIPFPWFFPLNAAITFLCGWGLGCIQKR
ncbi:MAG: hypothetical protein AAF585_06470 [Verrucomicrobiota bacterium]